MDGNIVSAGSFAAAVLETMGYVTQAHFLEDFRSFFRDAGALVYFIGLVGALLSYVLYGSARAVRYLLIGPALFWYLVGPTTDIQGAVSKLGGGQPRGLLNKVGEGAAKADVNKVAAKAGTDLGSIKVSSAFWLFVKPINDVTEHLVGVFLNNESAGDGGNQLDRQMADKVRGLELISRMIPSNPDMIHRLEDGLLKHCSKSYYAALSTAETYIKDRSRAGISTTSRQAPMSRYQELNATKNAEFKRILDDNEESMPTNETGFAKYIETQQETSQVAKKAIADGKAINRIPCRLAWDIFLEELWYESAKTIPDSIILTSGDWNDPSEVEKGCKELSRKLYDDAADTQCNLTPGIALATLFNHTSRGDTFGRVLARHSTYNDPMNPGTNQGAVTSVGSGFAVAAGAFGGPIGKLVHYGAGVARQVLTEELVNGGPNGTTKRISEWAPLTQLHAINGIDHATYISMPAYELTRVRQQLYTWAMQLPYYQGVLLYFLALAYPFLALLVLIPGKAQNVLLLPMAWMWIKSWDVGIAVVILLERVMYNILPNWALPKSLQEGPWTWEKLPVILGEGYNFNHVVGISQHYTVLSMVLLAIPPITGAIFLKGKKSILANFTSAVENQSRDAAQRAASMHSIATSSERSQMMQKLRGVAFQMPRLQSGGLGGGQRGGAAQARTAISQIMGSSNILTGPIFDKKNTNFRETAAGIMSGVAKFAAEKPGEFVTGSAEKVGAEVAYESAMRESFDPIYGRWGSLQMFNDAYSSALDGAGVSMEGGFETNQAKTNPTTAIGDMYKSRIGDMVDARLAIATAEGQTMGGLASSESGLLNVIALANVSKLDAFDAISVGDFNQAVDAGVKLVQNQNSTSAYELALNTMYDGVISQFGPAGYEAQSVRDRLFMVDQGAMQNEEVQNAYKKASESLKGTATGALLSVYYGKSLGGAVAPGGVNDFANQVREFGGDRTVEVLPAGHPGIAGKDSQDLLSSGRLEDSAKALAAGGAKLSDFLNTNMGFLGFNNPEVVYRNNQIRAEGDLSKNHPEVHRKETQERYHELERVLDSMKIKMPAVNQEDPKAVARSVVDWATELSESTKSIKDDKGKFRKQDLLRGDLGQLSETAPALAIQEVTEWVARRGGQATATRAYQYQLNKIITEP